MQTPPPDPATVNYPRPNLADDRQVLREMAISQKNVMLCIVGQVGVWLLGQVGSASHLISVSLLVLVLALALLVFMVISVVRLSKTLSEPPVVYAILMFIPCVSLIMLAVLSGKATKHLKLAGIKVGFLGADPNSI